MNMRTVKLLIIPLFMTLLYGCSGGATVPDKNYYRLPDPVPARADKMLPASISVERFTSDGIHGERAVLYSDDSDAVRINKYHYSFWTNTPPLMMQDHLISYLRAAGAAKTVLPEESVQASDYRIFGYVRRFEQLLKDGESSVVVSVELRVATKDRRWILVKDYTETVGAGNDSIELAAKAFHKALNTIYSSFLKDLTHAAS